MFLWLDVTTKPNISHFTSLSSTLSISKTNEEIGCEYVIYSINKSMQDLYKVPLLRRRLAHEATILKLTMVGMLQLTMANMLKLTMHFDPSSSSNLV